MRLIRVQVEGFVVAADEVDGTKRGGALQPLMRSMGFEPNGVQAWAVPDGDVKHLPARARKLLEDATKAEYGPAASLEDLRELQSAVLAANGGQIQELDDELASIRRTFGYPTRAWVLERTRRALERATAPTAVPAG